MVYLTAKVLLCDSLIEKSLIQSLLLLKGDRCIRYFEVTQEPPYLHYLSTFHSSDSFSGICWMPKRGCDTSNCEIARCFTLTSKGSIQVISFAVPRTGFTFQEDIFPDTLSDKPTLTAQEWIAGVEKSPNLVIHQPLLYLYL